MKLEARGPKRLSILTQVAFFILGLLISGWAFIAILMQNKVLIGGLPGVTQMLNMQLGWDVTIALWAIGVPILFVGWFFLGKLGTINSLAGALLLPVSFWLFRQFPQAGVICENLIVASVFGGFLVGIGLGLVFKANASVGGFSLLARIANKYTGISVAKAMMIIDMSVLIVAIHYFGFEKAFLAIISVVAMSKGIDLILTGVGHAKSVSIITTKADEMKELIYERVDCGITVLDVEGGHSGEQKKMLVCVVPVAKLARLKRNVERVDPGAFTVISDAAEVLGYGFS